MKQKESLQTSKKTTDDRKQYQCVNSIRSNKHQEPSTQKQLHNKVDSVIHPELRTD